MDKVGVGVNKAFCDYKHYKGYLHLSISFIDMIHKDRKDKYIHHLQPS